MSAKIHDPLKCGGCGGDTFKLTNVRPEGSGRDEYGQIRVTCLGCKSVSIVSVGAPKLEVDWSDPPGKGVLCGGWGGR